MPGRSRSRGLGASRLSTRRTVDGIVGFRRSWSDSHLRGTVMVQRCERGVFRVAGRAGGGGSGGCGRDGGEDGGVDGAAGAAGGEPGGRDAHVRLPPRRRSPKGRYHRGDPIIAAIRCAPVANCFAAAQRGRVARVGAGSGAG